MLELKIDDTAIDLPDAFQLESEENNPLFAMDNFTEGSFCKTVSVPYTPKNAIVSNYPQRFESAANHLVKKELQLFFRNQLVDNGICLFTASSRKSLDMTIGIGESAFVNRAKGVKIKEGNYGTMSFQSYPHVNRFYPQDYFALPPVRNPNLMTGYTDPLIINSYYGLQNWPDSVFGMVGSYQTPMMFFFYILNFHLSKLGYTLQLKISESDERLQTVIYTPQTMFLPEDGIHFNPQDYLPDCSLLELLVAFKKQSFLQFFINESTKTVFVEDVPNIKNWKRTDISHLVKQDYQEDHSQIIQRVKISRSEEDGDERQKIAIDTFSEKNIGAIYQSVLDFPLAASSELGLIIYCITDNQYYRNEQTLVNQSYVRNWNPVGVNELEHVIDFSEVEGEEYSIEMPSFISTERYHQFEDGGTSRIVIFPSVDKKGNYVNYVQNGRELESFGIRFLLNRGLFQHNWSDLWKPKYFFATNSVYNPYHNADGTKADNFKESFLFTDYLLENGNPVDYGLWETKIKPLLNIVLNKRVFTFPLNIRHQNELALLKFNEIMTINGSQFIIKKRTYNRTHNGVEMAEIECVQYQPEIVG